MRDTDDHPSRYEGTKEIPDVFVGKRRSGKSEFIIRECAYDRYGVLVVADQERKKHVLRAASDVPRSLNILTASQLRDGHTLRGMSKVNLYIDDMEDCLRAIMSNGCSPLQISAMTITGRDVNSFQEKPMVNNKQISEIEELKERVREFSVTADLTDS